jgi:hypothetical protein
MTARRVQKVKAWARPKDKGGVQVLRAGYARFGGRHNVQAPKWELTVYAIPIANVELVRSCLDSGGFNRIVEWFVTAEEYAGTIGSSWLSIRFDGQKLTYDEGSHL